MSEGKNEKRLTMKDFKALMEEQERRRSESTTESKMTLTEFLKKTASKEGVEAATQEVVSPQQVQSPVEMDPVLNKSPEDLRYMSGDDNHAGFSRAAIDREVLKSTLTHPLTLFPLGLGALSLLATALFSFSVLPAVALFGFGLVTWNVNFFKRKQSFAEQYIKKVQENIIAQRRVGLLSLDTKLKSNATMPIFQEDAVRGVRQLVTIQKKYNGFLEVLDSKLSKNEVTYSRYLGAAEQTNQAVINNLNTIASLYEALKTIDKNYIETRLRELSEKRLKDANDNKEVDELNKRLKLYNDHLRKIDDLLNDNERAFTAMDNASLSLGRINTTKTKGEQNLDDALAELEHMSSNADKYEAK